MTFLAILQHHLNQITALATPIPSPSQLLTLLTKRIPGKFTPWVNRKSGALDQRLVQRLGVTHRPDDTDTDKLRNSIAAMEQKHNRKMPGYIHRMTNYAVKLERVIGKKEKELKEIGKARRNQAYGK